MPHLGSHPHRRDASATLCHSAHIGVQQRGQRLTPEVASGGARGHVGAYAVARGVGRWPDRRFGGNVTRAGRGAAKTGARGAKPASAPRRKAPTYRAGRERKGEPARRGACETPPSAHAAPPPDAALAANLTSGGDALPPLEWALRFLPHVFTDAPADFHYELMNDLADPAKRLIARVAPRGHAKSTCATFAYPLWCICTRRRRNILIITHESSLATQFVRDIRNELECNADIRAAYGDLTAATTPPETVERDDEDTNESGATGRGTRQRARRGPPRRRKWSESIFTAANGVTVQARGSEAGLRGTRIGADRPDLILCDDIEKDELVASPESRRKVEHWLRRVVMPALAPQGQLVVLGSILHHDSLLANLSNRRRFPCWDYRVYRALEGGRAPADRASPNATDCASSGPAGSDDDDALRALWPARWPVQRLREERQRIGTLAFEQEYQGNPVDEATRVFRPEWLRSYEPHELVESRLVNLVAVDPATGAESGDYFALWAGGVDSETGIIYTRELRLERIDFVLQVRRIVEAFKRWNPVRIGVETTAYQAALKQSLDEVGRTQGLYLPVVALSPVGGKRVRIQSVAPFFENGTFRLPPALDPEAEAQFLHFPSAKHDDAPDVCAMAIALARSLATGPLGETRPRSEDRRFFLGTW